MKLVVAKDFADWVEKRNDPIQTERDAVGFTETELERDQKILQRALEKYPAVANAFSKLRCENAELKDRILRLEKEILRLQHERTPFHDLGQ